MDSEWTDDWTEKKKKHSWQTDLLLLLMIKWRLFNSRTRDSVYLLGLIAVLVKKGLDPVSIVWMNSLQVLNLHEETDDKT